MTRSRYLGVIAGAASLLLLTTPVWAQSDEDEMETASVEVVGIEYAFVGLPTSLPAGTEVTFSNEGEEIHEIFIGRIADDTTESLPELLEMGEEALASGKVESVGEGPLVTGPGTVAEGSLLLEQEGRYVALCFIPQGFNPEALAAAGVDLEQLGPDLDPATLSEEAQAIMNAPPHLAAGMLQEFTVTAAGTEAGPMPEPPEEPAA
jgi:plastocyanin